MLDTHARKYVQPVIGYIAKICIKSGLSANAVTVLSLLIGLGVIPLIIIKQPIAAVTLLWISGLFDAIDGTIARITSQSSAAGTLMDITFDRIVECGIIASLAFLYPDARLYLVFLLIAIIISMTIFLTVGALSEKKGMKSFYYQAGVVERTEGFIMFSLLIIFSDHIVVITIVFTILILFTALQRFIEGLKIDDLH